MTAERIFNKFHSFHGSSLVLDRSASVAYRYKNFDKGIAFSEKHLRPGELFVIEIEQNESRWSGCLRLGLTQLDPYTFETFNTELLNESLPNLLKLEESSWIYSVADLLPNTRELSWPCIIANNVAISDRYIKTCRGNYLRGNLRNPSLGDTPGMRNLEVGYKVGVVYIPVDDKTAELYYLMNGDLYGPYADEIPYQETPLYVFIDVYGRTKKVRILQIQADQSLKQLCRSAIHKSYDLSKLNTCKLPKQISDYITYKSNSL